jgi:hypothetical protein
MKIMKLMLNFQEFSRGKGRVKGKAQTKTKPEADQICREDVMLPTCTIL